MRRSVLFDKIKIAVLGKSYDLSVAFLSPREMRKAMKYKKDSSKEATKKVSNVLAFPLSKKSGEILLCKAAAAPWSVEFLFIHGLLHLKGLRHGATMEREERKLLSSYRLRAHE